MFYKKNNLYTFFRKEGVMDPVRHHLLREFFDDSSQEDTGGGEGSGTGIMNPKREHRLDINDLDALLARILRGDHKALNQLLKLVSGKSLTDEAVEKISRTLSDRINQDPGVLNIIKRVSDALSGQQQEVFRKALSQDVQQLLKRENKNPNTPFQIQLKLHRR